MFATNQHDFTMFQPAVYQRRRQLLSDAVSSGIALLPGHVDAPRNYSDNAYPFRQNSHFLYFAGLDLPGLFVVIDFDSRETLLFADELTTDDIIWTGQKPRFEDLALQVGITVVKSTHLLPAYIEKARQQKRTLHFLPPYRAETALQLGALLDCHPQALKSMVSDIFIRSVVALRSVKGSEELIEIDKAAEIGFLMHESVLKSAWQGNTEQSLAVMVEEIAQLHGAGVSFPVILTQRGEVLHGHDHGLILKPGGLVVCDAGAESKEHYASDFTRTIPVNGVFSSIQKALYQLVLDANNKAFELIKPGVPYKDIHLTCCTVLAEGLKGLGLMKGDVETAVMEGAHALFMVHGLGHMMGLDVHDMEDLGENNVGYDQEFIRSQQFGLRSLRLGKRLQEGFVLTVEPGLYFIPVLIEKWRSEKKFTDFICYDAASKLVGLGGIRLEDNAVVSATGNRMTGKQRIPVLPEEIAAFYR